MLEGVLSFLEDPTHADDPWVRLDSIRFEGSDGILDLSVMDYDCNELWARWRIRARLMIECSVGRADGDLCPLQSDHVVNRQYTEPRQELYFRGRPSSVDGTIGRLYGTHRHVAGPWIPFERFLNPCRSLQALLAGGFGLLANGPTFLIEPYAHALGAEGLSPNILASRPTKWWNGEMWMDLPPALAAISLGDSLIVAHSFEEERLEAVAG